VEEIIDEESEEPSTPSAPALEPAASTNDVLAQCNEAKVLFLAGES
jgi:hypothetical protein